MNLFYKSSLLEDEQRMAHFTVISLCFITWFLIALSTSLPAPIWRSIQMKTSGRSISLQFGVIASSLSCLCTHTLLEAPLHFPADSHQSPSRGELRRLAQSPSSWYVTSVWQTQPQTLKLLSLLSSSSKSVPFSHLNKFNPFELMRTAGRT